MDLGGYPVILVDTAGLRDTDDEVERIGVARSWDAINDADMLIFMHDLTRIGRPDYQAGDSLIQSRLAGIAPQRILQVYNKADAASSGPLPAGALSLSAKSGQGLNELRRRLLEQVGWQSTPEGLYIARERHVQALQRTREHLLLAMAVVGQTPPALDLLAEELRLGHDALGEITGQFSADDLLGEIFSKFCIGK